MKKTLTYGLIIGLQFSLACGFMIVDKKMSPNKTIVSYNDNLFKMADSVKLLYANNDSASEVVNQENTSSEEIEKEEPLVDANSASVNSTPNVASASVEEPEPEPEPAPVVVPAPSVPVPSGVGNYNSKPELGFNVTSGNRTYALTDGEIYTVARVVTCEANGSRDDILAVASVIMNRADARGITPVQVVAQPYQFSCYSSSSWASPLATEIVRDALGGIRNNNYHSFNGWNSMVSNNFIVTGGNRFY